MPEESWRMIHSVEVSVGVKYGQQQDPLFVDGFLARNYFCKSLTTLAPHDAT